MFFQQNSCGSPFYTGVNKKGIFLENLSYWHPTVIAAFVNLNLAPVQLEKYSSISYTSWMQIFSWINLFLYLWMVIAFCIFLYRKRNSSHNEFPVFAVTGFVLSTAMVGGLAWLSVTHDAKYTLRECMELYC